MANVLMIAALLASEVEGAEGTGHAAESVPFFMDSAVWVALAMTAVIALMIWKKVPAAIGKSLDAKIDAIKEQLAEAESLRKDAEALKAEYEAKAANADKELAAMLKRAEADAEGIVAKAEADAKALVERRKAMADAKIAAEERAAIDEIRGTAAKAARQAAEKLIRDAGTSDKGLVDKAIADL